MAYYEYLVKGHFDSGVTTVNRLHYFTDVPGLGSEPDAADVLSAINGGSGDLLEVFLAACATTWTCDSTEVVELLPTLSNDVPRGAVHTVGVAGLRSAGSNEIPEALTAIIAIKSAVPRRWARGYIAMPSPDRTADLASNGNWASAYITALTAVATKASAEHTLGTVNPTTLKPIVYSKTQRDRGADTFSSEVTAMIPRSKPKWRRSRLSAP